MMGLFAALNLLLLLAHVLAALSLYAVARYFGARPEWAFAGGVAFGLGHFLFWRTPRPPRPSARAGTCPCACWS